MNIDTYLFGSMMVDGKEYDRDLIIFPDKVKTGWWRREGHSLAVEDLSELIKYKPQILIVGKGAHGVMEIPLSTKRAIKQNSIELIDKTTSEAYKIFNSYIKEGKKVVGAFHLTC